MHYPLVIVGAAWVAFIVVWFSSALFAKRTLKRTGGMWVIRLVFIAIVLAVVARGGGPELARLLWQPWATGPLAWLGAILAVLGVALAIWARVYLGRNWGMPASVKEDPELVTSGPYRFIRHPIYSGMFVAMAGSALTSGLWWGIVLIVSGVYFIMSARKEEALMLATFPDTYPAYKARSKMLVPFLF